MYNFIGIVYVLHTCIKYYTNDWFRGQHDGMSPRGIIVAQVNICFIVHLIYVFIIHLIWHGWANSDTKLLVSAAAMMSTATYGTEHARNIVSLLWRPSCPQSLVMLPAKMADRIMLPDKVTEMENSIGYHTSINQSEESISIKCIIIQNKHSPDTKVLLIILNHVRILLLLDTIL